MHSLPDLVYGADERQRLDLFLPERRQAPLFVFVHGGSWQGGDKAQVTALGHLLCQFGYAVALPNYRLAPRHPYPAAAEDLAAALAMLVRLGPEMGVRTEGLCLAGHSAGGHLATLLALHPQLLPAAGLTHEQLGGVISISGVYDLTAYQSFALPMLVDAFGEEGPQWQDASPLNHVRAGLPPFFLAWAEHDYPGAAAQAGQMGDHLRGVGVETRLLEVKGRDHISILTGTRTLLDPLPVALAMFLRSLRASSGGPSRA